MERCGGGGGGGREGAGAGVGCGPGAQRGRWSVKSGGEDENIALKPHIPLGGTKLDSVRGGGGSGGEGQEALQTNTVWGWSSGEGGGGGCSSLLTDWINAEPSAGDSE